jgi:hypothetical protein
MIITLFEGRRSETYNSLAAAADAAKNWYSEVGEESPLWDYEIQTYDDLLEAVEEHKKRVARAVEGRLLSKTSTDSYWHRRHSNGGLNYG